ncbi:replication initiation protein, partial [Escherichia coli]
MSSVCQMVTAYFHERRSLNNFHRDRVITFEQIAE